MFEGIFLNILFQLMYMSNVDIAATSFAIPYFFNPDILDFASFGMNLSFTRKHHFKLLIINSDYNNRILLNISAALISDFAYKRCT